MNDGKKPNEGEARQVVRGVLSLKEVQQVDPDLGIKIGLFRDCFPLVTQVFSLKENQRELKYELAFTHEGRQPMGVRLMAVPADVPDDQVSAVANFQQHIPASEFKEGAARVDVSLSPDLYLAWLGLCRTYTIRGRVVCRRIVWRHGSPHLCISPVRGAKVTALDVDKIMWLCRRDAVGSAVTDANGFFEITFRFCCWWWPYPLHLWELDLAAYDRIRELLERVPLPIPPPEPELDLAQLSQLAERLAPSPVTLSPSEELASSPDNLRAIGQAIVEQLPSADLHRLHIWPWYPHIDCRPDIIFRVTQDCGDGEQVIYSETCADVRKDIGTLLSGVTLVANDKACCDPCCDDPPDGDCLVFQGVGCGSYALSFIDQNATNPLAGYGRPGSEDRPFGRNIRLLGVFGSGSDADFYRIQYRRWNPVLSVWGSWIDMPEEQMGTFSRGFWDPAAFAYQWQTVKAEEIDGRFVYKTAHRYHEENPALPAPGSLGYVTPIHSDWLGIWRTAAFSSNSETPVLADGLYELRVIGYEYDEATDHLTDEQILTLCPDEEEVSTMLLRLDNRSATWSSGSVNINTTEPDCDFPNICAVVKNEGDPDQECVSACGIVRLSAGDTLTVHFEASDQVAGHLSHYTLEAHWADSEKFNILAAGALEADPTVLVGPTYEQTFVDTIAHAQATYRASLPATNPEHDRPFWKGGSYKATVTVGAPVPGTGHEVFETCCAYLLRLDVWKRTTSGCGRIHRNICEFSFTVIRDDLTEDPNCPDPCPDPGDA